MRSMAGQVRKLAILATVVFGCAAADAKIIYVDADRPNSGNGTSWSSACKFLQDALERAKPGDSIYLAEGTYYPDDGVPNGFGDREISFVLDQVKLYGGFAGGETSLAERDPETNLTILSGEIWEVTPETQGYERYWSLHVVVLKGSSSLDGLTVQRGRANGDDAPFSQGGGVLAPSGTTLTLRNCIFSENLANESGGAVWGNVIANNCTFSDNLVNNEQLLSSTPVRPHAWLFNPDGSGGAIKGDATLTNCLFSNNSVEVVSLDLGNTSSATGGAIAGNVTAKGCTFDGNTTASFSFPLPNTRSGSTTTSTGGAIAGDVTATDCTFVNNGSTSQADSDVSPDPSKPVPYDSVARSFGGAIVGQVNATNCSFDNNVITAAALTGDRRLTTAVGGALHIEGTSSVVNCTFTENAASLGGAINTAVGSFLPVMDSTFVDNLGTGAAIACGGSVNILSNIIWYTNPAVLASTKMIHVSGKARISNRLYPTPSTETINLVRGGFGTITKSPGANIDTGEPPERTFINLDPLFVDVTNAIGPDEQWRTQDDGLRLLTGSPAIAKGKPLFLPKDTADLDKDNNTTEAIPIDAAGFARIQDASLDLGAYELGDNLYTPDISIEQPAGTPLVDGAASVDFSAFPGVATTFVIKNTGAADLRNLVVSINGADAGSYKFTQPPAKTLADGGTTTFTVTFQPKVTGLKTAALHIASNDLDENAFDIDLTGNALLPDIGIQFPTGTELTDGSSTVGFGNVGESSTLTKTFNVTNTGLGTLVIQGISFTGANAASFSAGAPVLSSVPAGGTTTFNVTFSPGSAGKKFAALVIQSNDPDAESSFLINVKGVGIGAPEIIVSQPLSGELADGETNDFGSVKITSRYSKTFVIKNAGTDILKNISVSLTGSTTFSKTDLEVTKLDPGDKASFTVTFKPSAAGTKNATLQIKSNDANESQIDLTLVGKGVSNASSKAALGSLAVSSLGGSSADEPTASAEGIVTLTKTSDGLRYLVLTVEKPAGFAKQVEVSPNLVDWFSGSKHTTTLLDNATVLQVRDNTPIKAGEKRYIRLK